MRAPILDFDEDGDEPGYSPPLFPCQTIIVQVKLKIRKLIEGESRNKPYSDNQLGQLLRRDNVFITRRTVAKYREQMQIPGSRERRIGYLF